MDPHGDTSKLKTECSDLGKTAIKCKLESGEDAITKCSKFYEVYKACRKQEHERIIDERRKKNTW